MNLPPWKSFERIPNAEAIAASLKDLPSHWSLTPLREKRPFRKGWQTEPFIPHATIADLILRGDEATSQRTGKTYRRFWSGFGLRLGEASKGLLAIDVDGSSAEPILHAISSGNIPKTVSWTSGKLGRCQLLFQIPEVFRAKLKDFTRAVVTEWGTLKTADGELLEFRYNRSQSALPPSYHPDKRNYNWGNSPVDVSVAIAPDWLCQFLLELVGRDQQDTEAKLRVRAEHEKLIRESAEQRKALGIVGALDLVDAFNQSVQRLSPEEIFGWGGHSFRQKGREWFGCCPQHQSQSGESFTVKPDSLDWYCYGCGVGGGVAEYLHFLNGGKGTPKGKDFYLITKSLAEKAGIELPKQQLKEQKSQRAGFKKEPEATQKKPRLNFDCTKEKNSVIEEKIRTVQRQLRSLSYKTDILLNQRYLPNDLPYNLPKSGLIGLVAPKGSGKSVLLKRIIQLAKEQGITILSITPRIALGREQAVKWEITWIDDYGAMQNKAEDTASQISKLAEKRQQAKDRLKELDKPQQLTFLDESLLDKIEQEKTTLRAEIEAYGQQIENVNRASLNTLGLCWDSIWRTENRDMEKALIIIDEAELGIKHFVTGSTCRRNRPYLLKVFADKIKDCLMSGGRVILSDADLTDLSIDYIRQLLPVPLNPFIVKNEYIGDETRWIVDFRTGSRGNTLDEILENIEMGSHLVITTDSQAEAVALEEKILSKFPNFCAFIGSNKEVTQEALARKKPLVVRLDSKTAEAEAGKKFIQKPNESIPDWKPRVVIYTPTLGVGVSIDETTQRMDEEWQELVPYFDYVYGLFFGVIEPSQCRQQLARVRANVPRIVWSKDSNKNLEGCPSFFPDEIKRQTLKYSHEALSILDLAKGIAGYEADDEQIREAMIKLLDDAWDAESKCWKDPSLDLYAALKARENYSLWNLANVLREELQDEGHTVISIEGIKTNIVGEIAQIKDDLKMQEATFIAQSPTMPLEEARQISSKLGATDEEKRSAQKTLLQEELPSVNLTPEFVYKSVVKDRRRWLNQHKLFWYYSNFEAVKSLDTDHWLRNLRKFVQGKAIMSDIRSFSPKAKAIRESGVLDFISLQNTEKIYQGDTEDAQKFLKQALKAKDLLQTALNITVTPKSEPIAVANRIISKVGLCLNKVTRSKKDNRYKLVLDLVNDPDRLAVLTALELRWQKSLEIKSQQATEVGGEVPVSFNTDPSSPPSFQGQSQGVGGTSADAVEPTNLENLEREISSSCNGQKTLETLSQQATEVGGEVPVSFYTDPSSPPSFQERSQGVCPPLEAVTSVQSSDVAELIEALPFVETVKDFALVVEDSPLEAIEDAIALADSQPRRSQLTQWLQMLSNPAVMPSEAGAYTVGQAVKVKLAGWANWLEGKISRILEGAGVNIRVVITQESFFQSEEVGVFDSAVIAPA